MKNAAMFKRLRAACCDDHGLGARAGVPRNDPKTLDEHVKKVMEVVLKAKRDNPRRAA